MFCLIFVMCFGDLDPRDPWVDIAEFTTEWNSQYDNIDGLLTGRSRRFLRCAPTNCNGRPHAAFPMQIDPVPGDFA